MSRAAKVDLTHRPLIALLNSYGATVQSTAAVGNGCPDVWIGYLGIDQAAEFKTGPEKKPRVFADGRRRKGTRTEMLQAAWHQRWKGSPRWVLRTADDVLALLDNMRRRSRKLQGGDR